MKFRSMLTILFILLLAGAFVGCTDTEDILKTTNALYLDIKTVVSDPAVTPEISTETMGKLVSIERIYLQAANDLQEVGVENQGPVSVIIDCGDKILEIIDTWMLDGKYERKRAAIRLSIKILKNHLQIE